MPSLVRTPEVWNNGGLLSGPTSPGSFSLVVWRCLSVTSSHCMLPSLVFSMFISLARHLCTLPNTLCSCFSVRKNHNMTLFQKHRDMSRVRCWYKTLVVVHVKTQRASLPGQTRGRGFLKITAEYGKAGCLINVQGANRSLGFAILVLLPCHVVWGITRLSSCSLQ